MVILRGVKMLKIQEIKDLITYDKTSERKRLARIGDDYYNGIHDIKNYRIFYYDGDGNLQEDTHRSNIKISHPFFTELVDQCIQYMFSDDKIVKSDIPELKEELDKYFGSDFLNELVDTGTDAKAKGFGYMYAYKSSNGRTKFLSADSMNVIEVRETETDDNCKYVIYYYIERVGKNHDPITKIQVWDKDYIYYYVQDGQGTITIDDSVERNPRPHIIYEKKDGDYGASLGYIPFFKLKNNRYEKSDVFTVKELIDDYDLMACGLSNNIQDFDFPIYAVSGFQGDNLDELIQNFKTKKTIGLGDGGNVEVKTIDIPYQARISKLQLDETNIYRFGMGFNSAQLGDGNITNVVIKSRYALLDLKCNKFEKQLRAFMNQLVQVALDEINSNNETDYSLKDIYYDFEREVMTNASDNASIKKVEADTRAVEINTLLNIAQQFDKETILQMICEQLDINYEDIKDKLPKSEMEINQEAEKLLEGTN
jgi:SPP1 family phage portal protein